MLVVALLRVEHSATFDAEEIAARVTHHVVLVRRVTNETFPTILAPPLVVSCKRMTSILDSTTLRARKLALAQHCKTVTGFSIRRINLVKKSGEIRKQRCHHKVLPGQ